MSFNGGAFGANTVSARSAALRDQDEQTESGGDQISPCRSGPIHTSSKLATTGALVADPER